jgi:hypothetical protein
MYGFQDFLLDMQGKPLLIYFVQSFAKDLALQNVTIVFEAC